MIERLLRDWIAFVLVALVLGLFVCVSIGSHREAKKEQKNKPPENDK